MNIYKLVYSDKESALKDLIKRGVYVDELAYGQGVHAVVEIGTIVLEQGTYDEEMAEITPPKMAIGYHFDVMCEQEIAFQNAMEVKNPKHSFSGFQTKEII